MNQNNLKDNEVYIIKNGQALLIDKPKTGFGKTILHWQDGKPISQEVNYTKHFSKTE